MAPSLWDNDTRETHDVARERKVEIQSKGICRASGKVYEKLLVLGLPPEHDLRVIIDPERLAAPLPARLVELPREEGRRIFVAVCDILPVREGRYLVGEVDPATGQVFEVVERALDFCRAKWMSRINYRIRRGLCNQIRNCDEGARAGDGRIDLSVTTVIPAPSHVIFRCAHRLPDTAPARIRVHVVNDALEVVTSDYVPMGTRRVTLSGGCGKALETRFSLRIPWNQPAIRIYVWDECRPGLISCETVTRERSDALVAQATSELYNNAGVDPYYPEWFSKHRATPYELELQRTATLPSMPTFSLVVPLFRTPERLFTEMLESVLNQSYQRWELILVNASPEMAELCRLVDEACGRDARVRSVTLEKNLGISENTNAGIAVATGDFVGFFDHDDLIEPDLLYEYARAVNERPDTDVLYCDEDKVDESGYLSSPFFKDEFNIDELRGYNVVCHLLCIRRSLLERLAPNTAEFDGAQDHNLTLEAAEKARYVNHVPRMLYHWRATAGSTAADADSKPYAAEAGMRAVRAHLERMGLRAEVGPARYPFKYAVNYLPPVNRPLVTVIIPTSDHADVLETCVSSILEKTAYENYEVLLVDNNSHEEETEACYERLCAAGEGRVRVTRFAGAFNFSAIVNHGAREAHGDYLLLLNNDTEVITPEWIDRMLGLCARRDVGAVGARLYYPDDTIQHAGVCFSLWSPSHFFINYPRENHGYFNLADCQRDLSAVTAACMMVRRTVFEAVGGFDERLAVAYNDVDFCLKVREKGLLVVYTPEVELYHYESLSRGEENDAEKRRRYYGEWGLLLHRWSDFFADGDPSYTPQLQPTLPNCCYYRF